MSAKNNLLYLLKAGGGHDGDEGEVHKDLSVVGGQERAQLLGLYRVQVEPGRETITMEWQNGIVTFLRCCFL